MLASFPPPGPNTPPHLSLVMKTFQSLFPPLSPGTISLSSARRVVLVSYNPEKGTIDFRHYLISVKPYGVSRRVRKVLEGATSSSKKSSLGFLDLGNERDVADFLLRKRGEPDPGGGYESAASDMSSVAGDDGDAVSLAGDYVGRNNKKGQKKAVKLDEIGPRIELRLIKIAEGLPGKEGGVIYHNIGSHLIFLGCCMSTLMPRKSSVKKTKKEISTLKVAAVERERLKKQRREEQERNVEKKVLAAQKKEKGKQVDEDEEGEDEDVVSEDDVVGEEEAAGDNDWDDEEEISGDEEPSESEAESEPEPQRPTKKAKARGHR